MNYLPICNSTLFGTKIELYYPLSRNLVLIHLGTGTILLDDS